MSDGNGKDKEEMSSDTGDFPELGEKLRNQEYIFRDGFHPLNNGSYGCVPKRVLKAQQRLIEERESNPEEWYRYRHLDMYREAVGHVAEFVGAKRENLVLVENATVATNCIVKSYKFEPGDQVLVTSHTYGAVLDTTDVMKEQRPDMDFIYVDIPVSTTAEEIVKLHEKAMDDNPRIKMALLDHITSLSAILMPIKKLIEVCHSRGVLAVIDGAHGPGQMQLNLEELGADFYYGNLHKWLFAPRGCTLLYIHPKHHSWIRSAVTSHMPFDEDLAARFHFIGTRDNIPYYLAKEAIAFHKFLGGFDRIVPYNRKLKDWAADMLAAAWKTERINLPEDVRAPYLCLVRLPQTPKLSEYSHPIYGCKQLMRDVSKHGVAIAVTQDRTKEKCKYLRVCAQVYNYKQEYFLLRDAVNEVLGVNP